ncbi:GIP, partial [Symbiodinium sp. CCMP2456]
MNDLSPASAEWWSLVEGEADALYMRWQLASPLDRIRIVPEVSATLGLAAYQRLEARAYQMLVRAVPEQIHQDLVASRHISTVALLYRVLCLFQPGGLAERQQLLQGLTAPPAVSSFADLSNGLRRWFRWFGRCGRLGVQVPDASLLLHGVDQLAAKLVASDAQLSFRMAMLRNTLRLDYTPVVEAVAEYAKAVQAEAELMSISGGDDPKKRPRVAALSRPPCNFWMTPQGCANGRACQHHHDLQAVQGVGRCWECSSEQHMRPECPVYKKRTEGSEGGDKRREEGKGAGKDKGKKGKGKFKDGKDKEVEVSKEQDKGKGKDGQRKWGSCFLCGSMDHKKPDCPLKKPKVAAAAVAPEVASSEAAAASASASAGPSSAQLVDEAVRALKSFRVSALKSSGVPLGLGGSRVELKSGFGDSDRVEGSERRGLIDGGATHPLRQGYEEEFRGAVPTRVGLASGSTTLHLSPVNTLLSKDPVDPIIPLHAVCSELGYRATWDGESGCVLTHPKSGRLDIKMVAGCPELPASKVESMIKQLEQLRATKVLRAVSVLNLRGEAGEEVELPDVLSAHVGDIIGIEVGLPKWASRSFPHLDPESVSALVPNLVVDTVLLPFNRRKRRQVECAKGVMLHLFGGSKQWGAAPGRVSLSVDWQRGVDFDAVYPFLLQLAVKGRVEGVVGFLPDVRPGSELLYLKVCMLVAVARAARERDNVFVALGLKTPKDESLLSWFEAGQEVLGDLHVAEAQNIRLPRSCVGVASCGQHLDSLGCACNVEVHTSSWQVFEGLHRTCGGSAASVTKLLGLAWLDWVRDPETVVSDGLDREGLLLDLIEAELDSGQDEPRLAKASSLEAFKSHVLACHRPYRSDCRVCLESRSRARKHTRSPSGPVNTLTADVAGPFAAGLDVKQEARYALVTVFSQAVEESDPSDFPLPSYEEGLELLESEETDEVDEELSEREAREADDRNAHWREVMAKCKEPARIRNFIQAIPLSRKNHHQVLLGLQKCYTRLKHLGFEPTRFHSDRGKEFMGEAVTRWILARDMMKTTTSGDDPAGNGKVEAAVNVFKAETRALLHAADLGPRYWPLAARHWAEDLFRKACRSAGSESPELVPFGARVMVRKRSWKIDSWSTRVCPARVLGPSPDLLSGYLVLPENPEDGKSLLISNVLFSQVRSPGIVTLDGVVEAAPFEGSGKTDGAPAPSAAANVEQPDVEKIPTRSDADSELLYEPVGSSERTYASGDYWLFDKDKSEVTRDLGPERVTIAEFVEGGKTIKVDRWKDSGKQFLSEDHTQLWVGKTVFRVLTRGGVRAVTLLQTPSDTFLNTASSESPQTSLLEPKFGACPSVFYNQGAPFECWCADRDCEVCRVKYCTPVLTVCESSVVSEARSAHEELSVGAGRLAALTGNLVVGSGPKLAALRVIGSSFGGTQRALQPPRGDPVRRYAVEWAEISEATATAWREAPEIVSEALLQHEPGLTWRSLAEDYVVNQLWLDIPDRPPQDIFAGSTLIARARVFVEAGNGAGLEVLTRRCKRVAFEEPGDANLLCDERLARQRFDAASMRALVDLLPELQFGDHAGPSPGVVEAENPPHLFVAGVHVSGGKIEVTRSCSDLPAVVRYMTAFVRANIDVPFAAVSLSDGSLLAPCRDVHNKRGSWNITLPLNGGALWIEDPECEEAEAEWVECLPKSGTHVKGTERLEPAAAEQLELLGFPISRVRNHRFGGDEADFGEDSNGADCPSQGLVTSNASACGVSARVSLLSLLASSVVPVGERSADQLDDEFCLLDGDGQPSHRSLEAEFDFEALLDSAHRLRQVLHHEEKALVEEASCGGGLESVETVGYLRKQVLALERAVEVHAVDQGLAEGTYPRFWAAKAEALVDTSEEVALEQQFLQTKTLSWADVEPELELWVPPARDEYECLLHEYGTVRRSTERELSDLQEAGYTVEWAPSKMVWTRKAGSGRRRARAVICGNFLESRKVEGSPTLAKAPVFTSNLDGVSFRCQLRVAGLLTWHAATLDVKKAFLNAGLNEVLPSRTIIATTPPRPLMRMKICPPQERWVVEGAFYGLSVSPRAWGLLRDRELGRMHTMFEGQHVWLEQSRADVSLWLVRCGPELPSLPVVREEPLRTHPMSEDSAADFDLQAPFGIIGVYVDDLLLTASRELIQCLIDMITQVWDCSDPEWASEDPVKFLGVEVRRTRAGVFHVSQETYLLDLLTKYPQIEFSAAAPVVPLVVELEKDVKPETVRAAQSLAGELTWAACRPRSGPGPDNAYRVNGAGHLLEMHCDASFGPDSGRSQTGLVAMFADAAVAWLSLRQSTTALSSAEAELNGCLEGFVLGESVTPLLTELLGRLVQRTMMNDNVSCVAILQYPSGNWRTRHLRLKARAWIEQVERQAWRLYHVPGTLMRGDVLTKQLPQPRLGPLLRLLGMRVPEDLGECEPDVRLLRPPLSAGELTLAVSAPCSPAHALAALVLLSLVPGADGFNVAVETARVPMMLPGWVVIVGLVLVSWTVAALGFYEGLKWFLNAALSWWRRLTRRTPAALSPFSFPVHLEASQSPVRAELRVRRPSASSSAQAASDSIGFMPRPEPVAPDFSSRRTRRVSAGPGHRFAIAPKGGECYHTRD